VKITILGAGAVGGWVGGAWASAGLDVNLIGRKAVAEEIGAHGLTVSDGSGDSPARSIHLPAGTITCTTDNKAMAKADLVVVTTKALGTQEAARLIGRHASKTAVVLSLQNGVDNVERMQALLPGRTILAGMVPFNVVRLGNGRWHKATGGDVHAQVAPLTEAIAEAIGKRIGRLALSSDMKSILWSKLLLNLNNAINALSGQSLRDELRDRDYRAVVAATQDEALSAMKLAGIVPAKMGPVPPTQLPNIMRLPNALFGVFLKLQKIGDEARSSMADDIEAGRLTEVEHLNGAVVALARKHGRLAEANQAIVTLIRELEAGVERKWTGKALRERVLGTR
jgi:2-dehydropantoate 2-reductase